MNIKVFDLIFKWWEGWRLLFNIEMIKQMDGYHLLRVKIKKWNSDKVIINCKLSATKV